MPEQGAVPTIESLLSRAVTLYQDGRQAEVLRLCHEVLERDPLNFGAIYLQGMAAYQLGQLPLAEKLLGAAVSVRPDSADALNEFGHVLREQGKLEPALECYLGVLRSYPDSAVANVHVALALFELGRLQEALQYCQAALHADGDLLLGHRLMGEISYQLDDLHTAHESFAQACRVDPDDIDALHLQAVVRIAQGVPSEALPSLLRVLARAPEHEGALSHLAQAKSLLRSNEAPRESFYNSGLIDQAEALAREDLERDNSVENHNFLLKCYLVNPRHSARDYLEESRRWSAHFAHEDKLPQARDFGNDRSPDRRLRVGIVGDYFDGVIGISTLLPLFRAYDREQLELHCYNFGEGEESLRPIVDRYLDIRGYSDEDFFLRVRSDEIDIMLDINGRIRTPNYFGALLRQPAPIQVNWYNLPCTVGVKAYNYAITDDCCVRSGEESLCVEKIFRLPAGSICCLDMGTPPLVPRPPFEKNGYVTFGCFGDFFKVNEGVLAAWAELLGKVPDSRLYLKSNNLRLIAERERVTGFFERRGIAAERLILEGLSFYGRMKRCYEKVDIALDTFPYSSGSTTINALWHGVPVVTIEGPDWRGRTTAANLSGCGLNELVACSVADYVALAAALAAEPGRLVDYRAGLGGRLAASPMCDVDQFARRFESVLRQMWHDWIATQ